MDRDNLENKKSYKFGILIFILGIFSLSLFCIGEDKSPKLAGEFTSFENNKPVIVPVPIDNYYFAKGVISVFGTRWRGTPKTKEEIEKEVWNELLLSYEAFKREITVKKEEVKEELFKIIKEQIKTQINQKYKGKNSEEDRKKISEEIEKEFNKIKVSFEKDRKDYKEWVKNTLGYSAELLENQVEHLLKIEKLKNQVLDSIKVKVTEEEMHQKFLDEYNSLSLELLQFDDLKKAEEFYEEVQKDTNYWENRKETNKDEDNFISLEIAKFDDLKKAEEFYDKVKENYDLWEEKKKENSKIFIQTELLSLKSLISEWKYPKEDVYKMLKPTSPFYPPLLIDGKYYVSKILQVKSAFKITGFVSLAWLNFAWEYPKKDLYKMLDYPINSFYPPVRIYKGYAVSKILEIRKAEEEQFLKRKDYYYKQIEIQKKHEQLHKWLNDLREKANVKIFIKE